MFRSVLPLVVAFLTATGGLAGNVYHVDGSFTGAQAGTAAQPWKTIQRAIQAGAVPGDTLIIRSGVYREGIFIPTSPLFKSPNPDLRNDGPKLTLQSAEGATVVIKGSDLLARNAGLWVRAEAPELPASPAAGSPRIWRYTGVLNVNVQQLFVHAEGENPDNPAFAVSNPGTPLTKLGYPTGYFGNWVGKCDPPDMPVGETSPGSRWDAGITSLQYMAGARGLGTFYCREAGHVEGGRVVVERRTLFLRLKDGADPNRLPIEISARPTVLRVADDSWATRDHGNLIVRGLHFRHSNSMWSGGTVSSAMETGHSSLFDGCTIEWMDCVGLGIWDHGTVQNCVLSHNGNSGLSAGGGCHGILVSGCRVNENNTRHFNPAFHCGGMKFIPNLSLHDRMEITIDGCEVSGNDGPGIWFDTASELTSPSPFAKVVRNCVIRDNTTYGIMGEATRNTLILGNLIDGNTRYGIYADACSDWWIVGNTVVNTRARTGPRQFTDDESAGISMHAFRPTIERERNALGGRAYWPAARNRVLNNIVAFNHTQQQIRIFHDDPFFGASDTRCDYNCIWMGPDPGWKGPFPRGNVGLVHMHREGNAGTGGPIFLFDSPREAGRKLPGGPECPPGAACAGSWHSGVVALDVHSIIADPGFLSPATGDYHLKPESPAIDHGLDLDLLLGLGSTSDLYGTPRPQGLGWDLGAAEFRR
ncbi:MAG TPA: hypothetical protein DCM86_07385 [Verrucomicrobiales bacterium]|nr:hypothetical protein [Verrucomicrobiales bacterium]